LISVQRLSKSFHDKKRGTIKAVDDISFECSANQVYGLLGPNGAGKTTTLRLLATILTPDSGRATICGNDIIAQPNRVRQCIGFLTGDTGLYRRLTGREILRYFASLYGMKREEIEQNLNVISNLLDLGEFIDTKTDKLSSGQKQRISIARTMIHNPPVLILDEPTAGLDVIASRAIIEFISRARKEGKTILFSTHVMREAERLCDKIGIIHRGRIMAEGTVDELQQQFSSDDLEEVFLHALQIDIPAA
jgi:sodium transport system ATP-binding protein